MPPVKDTPQVTVTAWQMLLDIVLDAVVII